MERNFKVNSFLLFFLLFILLPSGCSKGIFESVYAQAKSDDLNKSTTAFIILSNLSLSDSEIDLIRTDYKSESDTTKKYLYEFLLSKRTQEIEYIDSFIKSSARHKVLLLHNDSLWVSMISPIYSQLAYYANTNDEALLLLFRLAKLADGAVLSIVGSDLADIKITNIDRFNILSKKAELTEIELKTLMEGE